LNQKNNRLKQGMFNFVLSFSIMISALYTTFINSSFLQRTVKVDILFPRVATQRESFEVLLFNDGQDLERMDFASIFNSHGDVSRRVIPVGIHAGKDRKQEYGVIGQPDYLNRGAKADDYTAFVLKELIPELTLLTGIEVFAKYHLAGFSLGGLMAVDMALSHPQLFHSAAAFSGAFWWRSKALDAGYVEATDRILHAKVRSLQAKAGQQFFFQTGKLDEAADRNNNGIIDSIDDTLDLIRELKSIGFQDDQLHYLELEDGCHDLDTWRRVMPQYLNWLVTV
jgi:enterochelin esterase-like enzyme